VNGVVELVYETEVFVISAVGSGPSAIGTASRGERQ
jgi:hypothetical protein